MDALFSNATIFTETFSLSLNLVDVSLAHIEQYFMQFFSCFLYWRHFAHIISWRLISIRYLWFGIVNMPSGISIRKYFYST